MSEWEDSHQVPKIRVLVETFYDVQKTRIEEGNRIQDLVRRGVLPEPVAEELHNNTEKKLEAIEKSIVEDLKKLIKYHVVWDHWLQNVNGIGTVLAAGLIAYADARKFDSVSKLWAYAGLHLIRRCSECGKRTFASPSETDAWEKKMVERLKQANERKTKKEKATDEQLLEKVHTSVCHCEESKPAMVIAKRKRGELSDWNPKLKTHCWKMGESFVKVHGVYHDQYAKFKDEEQRKAPEGMAQAQIHARAKRKTVKLFLAHYWQTYRELCGLPTRSPYAMEHGGHQDYIPPSPIPSSQQTGEAHCIYASQGTYETPHLLASQWKSGTR